MTYKNEHLFPTSFKDVLDGLKATWENRDAFNYSATTLINTPREVHLCKRHKDEIVPDMIRHWFSFMGEATHGLLEKSLSKDPKYMLERRFILPVSLGNNITRDVGFKPDCYDIKSGTLYDYKITTSYIHGLEAKKEWEEQLNLYAFCLEANGYPVNNIQILVFYRDWRQASGQYKSAEDYPQSPVGVFDVPVWNKEQRQNFLNKRLQLMVSHENTPDNDLPECTREETWEKPSTFAVYRPGGVKALKLAPTVELAQDWIKFKKLDGVQIEHRQGKRTKCQEYCDAAPFCNQYQAWLKEQEKNDARALSS